MPTGRTLFVLLTALLLAVGAVWVAQRWVDSMVGKPVQQIQYAKVVVAAMDIPQWQQVEAAKLKEVEWPKDAVTQDMFTEISQAADKVAVESLYSGEPVSARRVLDPKQGNVFSLRIPPDKRAFTVRVNDVSGVGGFLLPDSRVDVLSAKKSQVALAGGPTGEDVQGLTDVSQAKTIVRDVRVLAVDQEAAKDNKNKPVIVRSVTVEVAPKEAEAILKAAEEGTVQFALRNPAGVDLSVEAAAPPSGQPPPIKAAAALERGTYRVVRGLHPSEGSCGRFECTE